MKAKRILLKGSILFIITISTILFSAFSFGATFCINNASDLQTALTTAASNGEDDTIQIVQGTYTGNFVYASTEANSLIVEGGYSEGCASREVDPANTILDGDATGNVLVLSCPDQTVEFMVDGLTLQNGKVSDWSGRGGGVYANSSTLTLTNNIIAGNSSNYGGGVYASDSTTLTLTNNTITGNSGLNWGGGVYANSSTLTLTNNTITGNSTNWGGGVYASNSTLTLTNNTITGNSANYGGGVCAPGSTSLTLTNNTITGNGSDSGIQGGGVYTRDSATLTLTNNIIAGNSASDGSGVSASYSTTLTLTNNIITGNSGENGYGGGVYTRDLTTLTLTNNIIAGNSSNYGGGVYASDSTTLTLTNNTITGNSGENGDGGGVYVRLYDNSDTAQIYNNIVYNNNANTDSNDLYINNDGNGDFIPSPVNLYNNDFDQSTAGTYIEIPFTIDSNNLNNENPLFVGGGNYHLPASSPCINKGLNTAPSIPTTDKDGNPRITGGTVDIGAYEYNSSAPVANAGSDQTVESGVTATLDGSASSDPGSETLIYSWTQINGTIVTLSDTTAVQPTFTLPSGGTGGKSLTFELKVTNETGLKNTDNVTINVNPATGSVKVNLSPQAAITAGAKWNIDGGGWQDSGATVSSVIVGDHTVNFKAAERWDAPGSETVTLNEGQTTEITGTYTKVTFTITAYAGSGGSISPSGSVSVTDGEDQAFTIAPNTEYYISDVLVDGFSVGVVTTYTFENVTTTHTIAATFATTPTDPSIDIGSGSGTKGDKITLPITLTNVSGTDVAAVSVDIRYDTAVFEKPKAAIGPSGDAADKNISTSQPSSGVFRVTLFSISNNNVIGDGVVAYLTLTILANAPGTETTLTNTPSASDPSGNDVVIEGSDSTVKLIGFLAGDCNGDGTVSIAEVQSAINMYLKIIPVEECVDVNDNGKVSIGEVQKVINNHLDASVASDYVYFDPDSKMSTEGIVSDLINSRSSSGVPLLDVGYSIGEPGKTVTVSISLANASGYNIAAISCDISYDTSVLEDATVAIGPAGSTAEKSVTSNEISSGVLRIGILSTSNSNVIGNGVVVYLTFSVKADASLGQTTLENTPEASDPSGNDVSIEGSNGAIKIAPAVYVQASGSCGGNTPCYSTIQAAVDAAETESIIRILQGTFDEDIIMDQAYNLTLSGGWNSTFTTQSSTSVINSLTIETTSGTVEIENINLQ